MAPGMAEADSRNEKGATALHTAAMHGQEEACRVLISYNADPAARDSKGMTPFHLSVLHGPS